MVVEYKNGKDGKNGQRDALLNDFELNQVEWASIADKTNAVCGNHEAIFKQSDAPGKKYDGVNGPGAEVDDL